MGFIKQKVSSKMKYRSNTLSSIKIILRFCDFIFIIDVFLSPPLLLGQAIQEGHEETSEPIDETGEGSSLVKEKMLARLPEHFQLSSGPFSCHCVFVDLTLPKEMTKELQTKRVAFSFFPLTPCQSMRVFSSC